MINIDLLTEAELLDLNHRIVERLKMLRQLRAHVNMLEFRGGERVLTRYNRKTVTVVTNDGHRWNVSPHFLKHVKSTPNNEKPIKQL